MMMKDERRKNFSKTIKEKTKPSIQTKKPKRPKKRPTTGARGEGYDQKRSLCQKSGILRPIGEN
jgi:hypothetical protein